MWQDFKTLFKDYWPWLVLTAVILFFVASCAQSNAHTALRDAKPVHQVVFVHEDGGSVFLAADVNCVTPEAESAEAAAANFKPIKDLNGISAGAFVSAFNQIPPMTALRGDRVIVFQAPGITKVGVVIFDKGCRVQRGFIHEVVYQRIINTMARFTP